MSKCTNNRCKNFDKSENNNCKSWKNIFSCVFSGIEPKEEIKSNRKRCSNCKFRNTLNPLCQCCGLNPKIQNYWVGK